MHSHQSHLSLVVHESNACKGSFQHQQSLIHPLVSIARVSLTQTIKHEGISTLEHTPFSFVCLSLIKIRTNATVIALICYRNYTNNIMPADYYVEHTQESEEATH